MDSKSISISQYLKNLETSSSLLTVSTPWGEAFLDAKYQRPNTEWSLDKRQSVITSLLNYQTLDTSILIARIKGLPRLVVHDGLQRTSAILDYLSNKFKVNNRYYRDLSKAERSRLQAATINLRVLDFNSLTDAVERFKVINTGGKKMSGFTALLADRATLPGLDLLHSLDRSIYPYQLRQTSQYHRMAIYTCYYYLGGEAGGYKAESQLFYVTDEREIERFAVQLSNFYKLLKSSAHCSKLKNIACSQLGYGVVGNGLRRNDSYAEIVNQLLLFNEANSNSKFRKDVKLIARLTKHKVKNQEQLNKLLQGGLKLLAN